MLPRTLAFAASLLVLLAPAASAHTDPTPSTDHDCSGTVDYLCWHSDCTPRFCVIMFCLVYVGHSGHLGGLLFGCTPP
jgi:hypothetical protein